MNAKYVNNGVNFNTILLSSLLQPYFTVHLIGLN